MVAHHCISYPCPLCYPERYYAHPIRLISPPVGCICPPTSEKTCQNPICPRKNLAAYAGIANTSMEVDLD